MTRATCSAGRSVTISFRSTWRLLSGGTLGERVVDLNHLERCLGAVAEVLHVSFRGRLFRELRVAREARRIAEVDLHASERYRVLPDGDRFDVDRLGRH